MEFLVGAGQNDVKDGVIYPVRGALVKVSLTANFCVWMIFLKFGLPSFNFYNFEKS